MELIPVGQVFAYFRKVGVAGVELTDTVTVGDRLRILGTSTDIDIVVESMHIERESVEEAYKGDKVGLKVPDRVRHNDRVYRVGGGVKV